ncbi:MAG: PDZ domain-containing protein [Bacteroidia bacterium]
MKNYSLFLMIALWAFSSFAQDTIKSVTIRINGDVNGKVIKMDTTLTVESAKDVTVILNELGISDLDENRSMEKTIIIRDQNSLKHDDHELKWFSTENLSDSMIVGNAGVKLFFSPDSGNTFTFIDGDKKGKGMNFDFDWDSDASDRHSRTFMGISMTNDESGGVRISGVENNSSAEKAGLRRGDIIVMIEKERIGNDKQLSAIIRSYDPGDKIDVTYIRGGKKMKTTVKLGKRD